MFLADGTEPFRGEWEAWRAVGAPSEMGPVMLIGGTHQDLTAELRKVFFELAGGSKASIVIIPTAIASAEDAEVQGELRQPWLDLRPASVTVLHTRDKATADDPAFAKPLTEATAVFFTNGHLHRIFDAYRGTLVEKELHKLQARGGLVGGTGTGAVVLGEHALTRPVQDQLFESGLGLLMGLTVEDERDAERFPLAIAANPHYVGLLVEPDTAAVIRGRQMSIMGQGTVTVRLATRSGQQAKTEAFRAGAECNLFDLRSAAGQHRQ
jgi:cyanophycinase